MLYLKESHEQRILEYIAEAKNAGGTHHAGMTYEDGLEAMIELMYGALDIDEVCE